MDDLLPSPLGTKQYWDNHYEKELENFVEFNATGDIWFGKSSEQRIIKYLSSCGTPLDSRILDLGSGNGHFCLELATHGYVSVVGIDYSENAIKLARKLSTSAQISESTKFKCLDLLSSESVYDFTSQEGLFDVAIDKGTFDAVTLTPDDANPLRVSERSRNLYLFNTHHLLRPGGILVITSCNWTAEELRQGFERVRKGNGQLFQFIYEASPLNSFTFGESAVTSLNGLAFSSMMLDATE
uniref:Protein-lysine N-methyltransferase EgrG_000832800 n=1 Tax=Echinococcus granulosus TaxID=6210 RepID=A0A068W8K7_ECHGR|nr:methyltransferase protein 10 [Echinococcus granulosus]